jgi:hypothetical protein
LPPRFRNRAPGQMKTRVRQMGWTAPSGINVPSCGLSEPATKEPPAMSITMIGLDTAKSVFQIHAVDETGKRDQAQAFKE